MLPPYLLAERRILCHVEIASKKRLLETLAELLATACPTRDTGEVFERLLERERLGGTGLGHGVALPHARIDALDQAIGAFVSVREAVDFGAIDQRPVDLALALLVPEADADRHVHTIGLFATLFSDPEMRERLRRADQSSQVLTTLLNWREGVVTSS